MLRRLAVAALAITLAGCSFASIDRDSAELDRSFLWLGWTTQGGEDLTGDPESDVGTITVAVYTLTQAVPTPVEWRRVSAGSRFGFLLDSGHEYHLVAWRDLDGDGVPGEDEPSASARAAAGLAPGSVLQSALTLSTRSPEATLRADLDDLPESGFELVIGGQADLDEERFSSQVGSDGYWAPIAFAEETDLGVFFLEPWDPSRIPVLFFYGAAGSIQDFRYQIEHLDRTRYQPWFLQWPTAARLESVAEVVYDLVDELRRRLGFERLVVVAHSMGGLVARGYLIRAVERQAQYQPYLVTFSTPWEGSKAAATGLKMSPTVVPSWIDMDPDSDYLVSLASSPLQSQLPWALFFSYDGGFFGEAGDGTVTVSSQLARWAQDEAIRLEGFDEDHTSILQSPEAFEAMNRFLDVQLRGLLPSSGE